MNKKLIKVPGFMMPLEAEAANVKEFLFVPSMPACQHVPPPPPNLTIMVKMKDGKTTKASFEPVWLTGTLKVREMGNKKVQTGDALFEVEGQLVEPYK